MRQALGMKHGRRLGGVALDTGTRGYVRKLVGMEGLWKEVIAKHLFGNHLEIHNTNYSLIARKETKGRM